MEACPPYMPDAALPAAVGLSIVNDLNTEIIEMEVHGQWSGPLSLDVYSALQECLAEHPAAVIIDLSGLSDLDLASTSMWLAASRAAAALQPPAHVALCLPPTRQLAGHLRQLGAVRFLPIYATMKQARTAVAARLPAVHRMQLNRLRPGQASAGLAADAVTIACTAWGLPELADPARQIMTELVTHANAEVALAISLRGVDLHLAVHDRDQLPGAFGSAAPAAFTSDRHLPIVDSRASAWGTMPTRDGRVVWAIVRPRPQPS